MMPNKIIPRILRKKVNGNNTPKIEVNQKVDVQFNPEAGGEIFGSKEDCKTIEIEPKIEQEIKEEIIEDGKTFGSKHDCGTEDGELKEDGKMFGSQKDAPLPPPPGQERDQKATELNTKSKKILFSIFFQIIGKNGDQVTAKCKECKAPVEDSITTWFKIRYHLKVCLNGTKWNKKKEYKMKTYKFNFEISVSSSGNVSKVQK